MRCELLRYQNADNANLRRDLSVRRSRQLRQHSAEHGGSLPEAHTAVKCCLTAVQAMFKRIRIADCAAADRITAAAARRDQPKRVALLAPRTIHTVVPSYWFALALLDGVVLLTCLTRADLRISAVFVCASTLVFNPAHGASTRGRPQCGSKHGRPRVRGFARRWLACQRRPAWNTGCAAHSDQRQTCAKQHAARNARARGRITRRSRLFP